MTEHLTVDQFVSVLLTMADDLAAAKGRLNDLDAAIGDGDLGITMARGFAGVRAGLESHPQDIGRILMKAGMDFNNAAASTMGALLATAFMRAGKQVHGAAGITLEDIVRMVRAAETGIMERGKAQIGDKTMLEAIAPAREALESAADRGEPLLAALEKAATAAEAGALSTVEMQSAIGRASWLGERTIGHQDPGATMAALMLASVAQSVKKLA